MTYSSGHTIATPGVIIRDPRTEIAYEMHDDCWKRLCEAIASNGSDNPLVVIAPSDVPDGPCNHATCPH